MNLDGKKLHGNLAMGKRVASFGNTQSTIGENRRLIAYGLPIYCSLDELKEFFGEDQVEAITLFERMAFVQFKRPDSFTQGLLKNKERIRGNVIEIKPYKKRQDLHKGARKSPSPRRSISPIRRRTSHSISTGSTSKDGRPCSRSRDVSRDRARSPDEIPRRKQHEQPSRDYDDQLTRHPNGYPTSQPNGYCSRERVYIRDRDRGPSQDSLGLVPRDPGSDGRGLRDERQSTSLVVDREPALGRVALTGVLGPPGRSSSLDQAWGSLPESKVSSNMRNIFAGLQPVQRPLAPHPMQPQVSREVASSSEVSQLQPPTATTSQSLALVKSAPEPSSQSSSFSDPDPLAVPPRIKCLMKLVLMQDNFSAISLDQVIELEQTIEVIRKEMETARANTCSIESATSQNGNSVSEEEAPTNGNEKNLPYVQKIAEKIRSAQR